MLDTAFRKDDSRVRSGQAAGNVAVPCRIALTLLLGQTTTKVGVKTKRLMCGWDETYLAKSLTT